MDDALRAALERSLGSAIAGTAPVHGGDVAIAYRLDLADGRRVFAKTHRNPPPGFFTTEAAGLTWLRDAGTIAVPEVLAVSDDAPSHLVLEWIERGSPRVDVRSRPRARPGRPAPCRRAVLRARGPPHHRQPRPAQRADRHLGRVLRHPTPRPARPSGARERRLAEARVRLARGHREAPRPDLPDGGTAGSPPRRPVGRQPPRRLPTARAGSSTPRHTAATASSTSR